MSPVWRELISWWGSVIQSLLPPPPEVIRSVHCHQRGYLPPSHCGGVIPRMLRYKQTWYSTIDGIPWSPPCHTIPAEHIHNTLSCRWLREKSQPIVLDGRLALSCIACWGIVRRFPSCVINHPNWEVVRGYLPHSLTPLPPEIRPSLGDSTDCMDHYGGWQVYNTL